MANINELIENGELEKAVNIIYTAMRNVINRQCPGINLTNEQWDLLAPVLHQKFEDPTSVTREPTPDIPGDDVEVTKSKAKLTIVYTCDDDVLLPGTIEKYLAVGDVYEYYTPYIKGYVADITVVRGRMTATDAVITVTYVKEPEPTGEKPAYGTVTLSDTKNAAKYTMDDSDPAKIDIKFAGAEVEITPKGTYASCKDDAYLTWFTIAIPGQEATAEYSEEIEKQYGRAKVIIHNTTGATELLTFEEVLDNKKCSCTFRQILTTERFKNPNGVDKDVVWQYDFDWNGDGVYEQTVTIHADPNTITLKGADGKAVWPE